MNKSTGSIILFHMPLCFALQSEHFPHYPVAHLYCSHQNQHVEYEFSDILPDHRCRCRVSINYRRTRSEQAEDDTRKNYDRTFQAYCRITFQKADTDALSRLSCESRKRYRCYCCVHEDLEESAVYRKNYDKGKHCYEQTPDKRYRP